MKTSASQFITWMQYLEWESNSFKPIHYYLAQVACEIRRSYVDLKKAKPFGIKDFILTFKRDEPKEEILVDKQKGANNMKNFFFALTGLVGKKKKGKR